MSKPKPHPAGQGDYPIEQLKKSYMAQSLNKMTRLSGGSSGYLSEARRPMTNKTKVSLSGAFTTLDGVSKTVIHRLGKRISKQGFVPQKQCFSMGFVKKVEWIDKWGERVVATNNSIS